MMIPIVRVLNIVMVNKKGDIRASLSGASPSMPYFKSLRLCFICFMSRLVAHTYPELNIKTQFFS